MEQDYAKFLKNSYKDPDKQSKRIGEYELDEGLSGRRAQVYVNPMNENSTVVVHRGSKSASDWITNTRLALGGNIQDTARGDHAEMVHKQVREKYGKSADLTLGHSLGGLVAENYGQKQVVTANKAVRVKDVLNKKIPKRQTDYRNEFDPVSMLTPFQRRAGKLVTNSNFNFNSHAVKNAFSRR